MYERFSERARKVMQLANQEAQRFNHEYIGTEHILLGLMKLGNGVACVALERLGIDLRKVRLEVEKIVQSGPDMVTMGKLPQSPRAKVVIDYAIEESRNFKHSHVGTEHLLLGLIREQEGVAAKVLMNLGVSLGIARKTVVELMGESQEWNCTKPAEVTVQIETIQTPVHAFSQNRVLLIIPVCGQPAEIAFTPKIDREGFRILHEQLNLAERSLLGSKEPTLEPE